MNKKQMREFFEQVKGKAISFDRTSNFDHMFVPKTLDLDRKKMHGILTSIQDNATPSCMYICRGFDDWTIIPKGQEPKFEKEIERQAKHKKKPDELDLVRKSIRELAADVSLLEQEVEQAEKDIDEIIELMAEDTKRLDATEDAIQKLVEGSNAFAKQTNRTNAFLLAIMAVLAVCLFALPGRASEPKTVAECKTQCLEVLNQADAVIAQQEQIINYMVSHIKKQTTDIEVLISELSYKDKEIEGFKSNPLRNPWLVVPAVFLTGFLTNAVLK